MRVVYVSHVTPHVEEHVIGISPSPDSVGDSLREPRHEAGFSDFPAIAPIIHPLGRGASRSPGIERCTKEILSTEGLPRFEERPLGARVP